jgi:hypothetical protein
MQTSMEAYINSITPNVAVVDAQTQENASANKGHETPSTVDFLWNGEEIYRKMAESFTPITDKVTTHTYQIMYGKFLLPYYHQFPTMKMLEIGLGRARGISCYL